MIFKYYFSHKILKNPLTLGFTTAVYATGVTIREAWVSGGFVVKVELLSVENNSYIAVWAGIDTTSGNTISFQDFNISFNTTSFLTNGVKITTNTNSSKGYWEYIDSVQLTGNTAPTTNALPTGDITINGTLSQNQTLTATSTLADADGLGTLNYQWFANNEAIAGATNTNYSLTQTEVGKAINVSISYTDGNSYNETVISDYTDLVANVNDTPTGIVSISGTATQKQVLTANNTLQDADGLGAIKYQWFANNVAINNATANTVFLSNAQVNKIISVTASYIDAQGTNETVTSSASSAVANINDAPKGSVAISNTAPKVNDVLTATNTITDADGLGTITYTWKADATVLATGSSYTVQATDVDTKITVTASYTDGFSTAETITSNSTAAVFGNHLPTGTVLVTGTPAQYQTLTASNTLADVDGLGTFNYQWFADNVAIAGATANTYVLTQTEVGKTITLNANYTDLKGTNESVTSSASSAVANVNDLPIGTVTIAGNAIQGQTLTVTNNLADIDGLGTIVYQWFANNVAIANATKNSYVLTGAELNKTVTVTASYTDLQGTNESVTSVATDIIIQPVKPEIKLNNATADFSTDESGDTASFTVKLTTPPTRDVTINFTSSDTSEGTITNSSLTFTASNYSTPQTVTIKGVNDYENDGDQPYIVSAKIVSDDVNYRQMVINPVVFTNHEDVTLNNDIASQIPQNTPRDIPLTIYGDAIIDTTTLDNISGLFLTIGSKLTNDVIQGLDGADVIYGLNGSDDLSGGIGNDTIYGGYGIDFLYGNDGNDLLYGEQDADKLTGGTGNDTLDGGLGTDTLMGGAGNDTYYLSNDTVLDTIDDQGLITDIDTVITSAQIISYVLPVNIENGSIDAGTQASNLTGNISDNNLNGNEGSNGLNGGAGRDSLSGGNGNDTLSGGANNDTLTGGVGKDIFKFDSIITNNIDRIADFSIIDDTIQLKNTTFTALIVKGVLNSANFVINPTALDTNDFVIYNKTNGALIYDADGSGAGAGIQIATLGLNLALTNADFVVI